VLDDRDGRGDVPVKPAATAVEARADALASALAAKGLERFELALVLGSGLGAFAEALSDARAVPYEEFEGLPRSSVAGHAGRFVVGNVGATRVLVQQGRAHLYEGWSAHDATRAVRAFAKLGCRGVVLTNAAGGLRREWRPGTLVRLTDHVNMQGRTPLLSRERSSGTIYGEAFGAALERGAADAGIELARGVYCGLLGPSYETPAEIRMLAGLGVDLVGMSTVAEACVAHASGMQVAGLSLVTNQAAGISATKLDHAEVLAAGAAAAEEVKRLLLAAVPHLAR
jgi:purine-nucleoside phosphorylase